MKPVYSIAIGSLKIDSTRFASAPLPVDILVRLRLNDVNTVRMSFGRPEQGAPAVGDPIEVELGSDGSLQKVFTGPVQAIEQDLRRLIVYGQSSLGALVSGRLNKMYEQQKAGEIVSDLASQSDIAVGQVENGIQFAVYALSDAETMLDHVLSLAQRNGYDCYADADDKLVFRPYDPSTIHALHYGIDVLEISVEEGESAVSGVEVYGESPSSLGEGAEAYSWLTKKDVKGTAGLQATRTLRLFDPQLKDVDGAGSVAQAFFERLSAKRSGRVKVLGAAHIRPGEAIEIRGTPNGRLDDTFKVTAVEHRFNKLKGFVTTIRYVEV